MKKLEYHPLANFFPLMEDEEFDEFCADAKDRGISEQIVLLDGKILDGRNRYRAALKLKIDCPSRKYDKQIDGDDPAKFVESVNIRRRHLTPTQKAVSLAQLRRAQICASGTPEVGLSSAAKEAGISDRKMDQVSKVVANAPTAVVEAVKSGDVSVSDAAAVSELPKAEQKKALAKVEAGKAKTLKAAVSKPEKDKPRPSGKQTKDPRAWESVESLYGQLTRAVDKANGEYPHHNLWKQAQKQLNDFHATISEWKRAKRGAA